MQAWPDSDGEAMHTQTFLGHPPGCAAALASMTVLEDEKLVPPVFVPLDPFTVNLADKESERYAQVGITLEIEDAKFGDQLKLYMPAIRNNILMVLAHKRSSDLLERSGKEKLLASSYRRSLELATAHKLGGGTPLSSIAFPPLTAAAGPLVAARNIGPAGRVRYIQQHVGRHPALPIRANGSIRPTRPFSPERGTALADLAGDALRDQGEMAHRGTPADVSQAAAHHAGQVSRQSRISVRCSKPKNGLKPRATFSARR